MTVNVNGFDNVVSIDRVTLATTREEARMSTETLQVQHEDDFNVAESHPHLKTRKWTSCRSMRLRRWLTTMKRTKESDTGCPGTNTRANIRHGKRVSTSTTTSLRNTVTVKDGQSSEDRGGHCSEIFKTTDIDEPDYKICTHSGE